MSGAVMLVACRANREPEEGVSSARTAERGFNTAPQDTVVYPTEAEGGAGEAREQGSGPLDGPGDLTRQVRGVVESVSRAEGRFALATNQGRIVLQAKPFQIAGLRQGEVFTATFSKHGGDRWLTNALRGQPLEAFGRLARFSGRIEALDKADGAFTITSTTGQGGIHLQAHPAELQALRTGQRVNVTAQRIGDTLWVSEIVHESEGASGTRGRGARDDE